MPSKPVGIHEEALAEAQAAYDWYTTQNPAATETFIKELDQTIEQAGLQPGLLGLYVSGTRDTACDVFLSQWFIGRRQQLLRWSQLPTVASSQAPGKNDSRTEEATAGQLTTTQTAGRRSTGKRNRK